MATKTTKTVTESEVVVEAAPVKKEKAPRKFLPNDTIACRSITHGQLVLEGKKTKLLYVWANAGDVTEVEYQDLHALQSFKSRFLIEPLFIIEDEDLVEQWSSILKPVYSKIEDANVEEIFKITPAKIKSRLKNAPEGLKKSIKSMAAAKIISGELDSLNRIKAIDEALGTELISMIS